MADLKKIEPVKKKGFCGETYYFRAKNGGFQLMKLTIEDDVVLLNAQVSDPDAWNQVMNELEQELSLKFQ